MTPEERRNSLAEETAYVAKEDQIFLFENQGTSAGSEAGYNKLSSSNKAVEKYDKQNGTDVKGFFDFLRGGSVFEKGKPTVFHIANAGNLLEKYGIKDKFMVGQFTFSKGHT